MSWDFVRAGLAYDRVKHSVDVGDVEANEIVDLLGWKLWHQLTSIALAAWLMASK